GRWVEILEGDGVLEAELRILDADGQARWLSIRTSPEHDALGERVGFVAALIDVHERHLAEQAAAAATELYRSAINSRPELVVSLSARALRCVRIGGGHEPYTTERCAGLRIVEFGDADSAALLEPPIVRALAGEASDVEYQSPIDGSEREVHVRPMTDG